MREIIKLSAATEAFLQECNGQFIDGVWVVKNGCNQISVVEPSNDLVVTHLDEADVELVKDAVESANKAFQCDSQWRQMGPTEREKLLHAFADAIENDAEVLSELITLELGAPIMAARFFEVAKAVETFRYFAGYPSKILGDVINLDPGPQNQSYFAYTDVEPVGVVAAIVPWNAPLMIAAWKLAPALAAGCTVVMKPSEDASLAVLRLAKLAAGVGIPKGVFNVVVGRGESTGELLLKEPGIDKYTFTGSMRTGKRIHQSASEKMARLSLELGGKSPVIVLNDADMDEAVPGVAMGAFANSGQVCVAGSKVYVHEDIQEEFTERVVAFMKSLKIGSGFLADTDIGPLVSKQQQEKVCAYVDEAFSSGAKVYTTENPESNGFFVTPTVITDLPEDSRLLKEEIFGPVMTIQSFQEIDDIVTETNDSMYGLAAMVWSDSQKNIQLLCRDLRVGTVFVNTSAFPPAGVPTGGFRESGVGRDLGEAGIEGYLERKSVIAKYA